MFLELKIKPYQLTFFNYNLKEKCEIRNIKSMTVKARVQINSIRRAFVEGQPRIQKRPLRSSTSTGQEKRINEN